TAAAEAHGYACGRADAEAALAPLRLAVEQAIAGLQAAHAIEPAALQPLFADLVIRIAGAVIDGELRQSADAVERLVAAGLAAIEIDGAATIRLSPGDAARLALDH